MSTLACDLPTSISRDLICTRVWINIGRDYNAQSVLLYLIWGRGLCVLDSLHMACVQFWYLDCTRLSLLLRGWEEMKVEIQGVLIVRGTEKEIGDVVLNPTLVDSGD